MRILSRRDFVGTSAFASIGWRMGAARPFSLTSRSKGSAANYLPDPQGQSFLKQIATAAVDAAHQAGATYADIRVADLRRLRTWNDLGMGGQIQLDTSYGISVLVDGAWSFAFGVNPDIDRVTNAVRNAIRAARSQASWVRPAGALPRVPVPQGEWSHALGIDPFTVPFDDHLNLLGAFKAACERVPQGMASKCYIAWTDETRVFASTEGALVAQRFRRVEPDITMAVVGRSLDLFIFLPFPGLTPCSAGFEIATGVAIQEQLKTLADEADRLARLPIGHVDVGRYEAVMDGAATAAVAGATLAPALELERILEDEADGEGTSYLSLSDLTNNGPFFSPLLSATTDRAPTRYGGARWDDEGLETRPMPLITNGKPVAYLATRRKIASLGGTAYKTDTLPLAGCATAWSPTTPPAGRATQLNIVPATNPTNLDALVSSVDNGILIRGGTQVQTDQQLSGGVFRPNLMLEIKRGKITRCLTGGYVQFGTKTLWKSLQALGDSGTAGCFTRTDAIKGDNEGWSTLPTIAPAAVFKQLDVRPMVWA